MDTILKIKRPYLATLFMFIILMTFSLWVIQLVSHSAYHEKTQLVSQVALTQAKSLEKVLHTALVASTKILAVEVIQNKGHIKDFDQYAEEVLSFSSVISNLQLAPDGIIESIYPLKGNERAIGHDLLKDDKRRAEALIAIDSKQLTLAGPFILKQGGSAVIARRPIFLTKAGKEEFWGFASALVFVQDLIDNSQLHELDQQTIYFQLSRTHPDTHQLDIFYGKQIPNHWIVSKVAVDVPNTTWHLTIGLNPQTAAWDSFALKVLMALLICAAFSFCFFYYITLPKKLQHAVEIKTKQLYRLANTDMLTGLDNRRKFTTNLDLAVSEATLNHKKFAIFYLDIDNFKVINDQFGHYTGDQVLKEIAKRLLAIDPNYNLHSITRISGDEFSFIVEYENSNAIELLAHLIISQLNQPWEYLHQTINLSVSMGVTLIPQDGFDTSQLMQNVDFAMYQAKNRGRNQFSLFDQAMKLKDTERLALIQDLKLAIEDNQFVLHYQPIYCIKTQEVNCYEALIRWNHPTKGLLFPDSFISIAEQTGLINNIGHCVLDKACEFISLCGTSKPTISINLSACQLTDPNLYKQVTDLLKQYSVDPVNIKLEITETTLMQDVKASSEKLSQFKQLGMSIAIDDFGTGYSSLAILKDLPADYLKIDKSFVDNICTNKGDKKVAQGIISLAHNLEMKVVAEGIETLDQEQLLKKYKCDFGQGYLFGRPTPLDTI